MGTTDSFATCTEKTSCSDDILQNNELEDSSFGEAVFVFIPSPRSTISLPLAFLVFVCEAVWSSEPPRLGRPTSQRAPEPAFIIQECS